MTTPLVSVIIPTWNGSAFIAETLQSVLAQTCSDLEILVIDDGSTDTTPAVVESFPAPIRLIRQKNAGTAAARNTGLAEARGQWIAFLDHDDLWVPQKLELQLAAAASSPCALYGGVQFFDGATGRITCTHLPPAGIDFHQLLGFEIVALQSLLCPAQAARDIGFDATLKGTDDWDFCIRLAQRLPFIRIPQTLLRVRIHDAQAGRQRESMFSNCRRVLAKNARAHPASCTPCATARRRARSRINAAYYEHLREEIVTGVRSVNPFRTARASLKALTRTPDQLAATFARKSRRLLGMAPTLKEA
ncbi:MAG TPA: glycosyltransferase family A protein [Phycisphaerae bacterium]|nr:glycosyltransferase family A protein [Phycisphaerae bacterium]